MNGTGGGTESAFVDVPYNYDNGFFFQYDGTFFPDEAVDETLNIGIRMTYEGIFGGMIYAQFIPTYEVGGIPQMLDNTPRAADIGMIYKNRFADCVSHWEGYNYEAGEFFRSQTVDQFYTPP